MSAQPTDASERNQSPAPDTQRSCTAQPERPDPGRALFETIPAPVARGFEPNTVGRPPANLILISQNSVLFYVDEYSLLRFSNNSFKGLLPLPDWEREKRIIFLPDLPSSELEILLQAIYRVPKSTPGTMGGSMDDVHELVRGVGRLHTFGIAPKTVILPHTYVFDRILFFSARDPLEVYALGGQYDIDELAVAASPHTLTVGYTDRIHPGSGSGGYKRHHL
uniref:BTB domain-containing protein n=1 Tax=Moniliophthora roreri TaxID=221103 RepID=A0A0W0F1X0_MONRR